MTTLDYSTPVSTGRAPAGRDRLLVRWAAVCAIGMTAVVLRAHPVLAQAEAARPVDDAVKTFDVPAGRLDSALDRFARTAGINLSYDPASVAEATTRGLSGEHRVSAALSVLLQATGFEAIAQPGGYLLRRIPIGESAAEGREGRTTLMAPVRVQGEAIDDDIFEQSRGVTRITREDIDRTGARHASEILQSVPGVYTATNEQIPSVSISIRGLKDFGRVNMNIDGMRQNYQRTGHQQRNGEMFFDPDFLSGVEVTKGSYAGAGGAQANGGVATFRTLEVPDVLTSEQKAGGLVKLSHGVGAYANEQDLSGAAIFAARLTDTTDLLFAYGRKRSGEYRPGRRGEAFYWEQEREGPWGDDYEIPVTIISGTNQNMDSFLLKGNWYASDASSLRFTVLGSRLEYGESPQINEDQAQQLDFYRQYCGEGGTIPDLEFCQTFQYDPNSAYPIRSINSARSISAALDYFFRPGGPWIDFSSKAYYVTTRNDSERVGSDFSLVTRTDTVGLVATNVSTFSTANTATSVNYGVEVFRDENRPDAESTDITGQALTLASGITPQGQRQIGSAWLRAEWMYTNALTLTSGLRWDHYRLWGITGFDAYDLLQGSPTRGNRLWQFQRIDVDHTESRVLPTFGAAYTVRETAGGSLRLFANAGLGWRPPAITETLTAGSVPYHNPPIRTFPNWLLKPEKTRDWEAGVNWIQRGLLAGGDELKLKLSYFHNTTEDFLMYAGGIGLPGMERGSLTRSMYANATNDLSFRGGELEIVYHAPRFYGLLAVTHTLRSTTDTIFDGRSVDNPFDRLLRPIFPLGGLGPDGNATGPGTYCTAEEDNLSHCHAAGGLYDPMVPEWSGKLTAGLLFFDRKLDVGARMTCASRTGYHLGGGNQIAEFGRNMGQRSFCVPDLYGSYRFARHLTAGYHLRNLTDRQYSQALGDAMVKTYAPGRTLTAFFTLDL